MIDTHVHFFPEKTASSRDLFLNDPGFALLYGDHKSLIVSSYQLTEYAHKNEISCIFTLGFSWENSETCKWHNDELLKTKKDFFVPFASVPSRPFNNIRHFIKNIADSGFKGVGEISFYHEGLSEENTEYLSEIFALCSEFSLFVNLHVNEPVGHIYNGKYNTGFDRLFSIINDNSDTIILLSHWGGGIFLYEAMPEVREAFRNVYYDTAASPYIYDSSIFKIAEAAGILKRVLFGTDYPLMGPKRFDSLFDQSGLSRYSVNDIYHNNAAALLERINRKQIQDSQQL